MKIDKELLVERLAKKMDLVGVFMYDYSIGDELREHLLLVVNPVKGVSPMLMAPVVKLCLADMKDIPFHIVLEGEWLGQLRKGSLYHSYASLPVHRLYYTRAREIDGLLNKKIVQSLSELAKTEYDKAKVYAQEYFEASSDFISKGDFGQGVFMLHQYLEFRIRSFYGVLGRQLGKSHNLEHIMKSIRGLVPELLSIFAYDGPAVETYRLLDEAYKKCRKGDTLEISEEQYDFIRAQSICLAEILDAVVDRMVAEVTTYRAQLPAEKPKEIVSPKDETKTETTAVGKATVNKSLQVVCEDFSNFPWVQQYKNDVNRLLDKIRTNHNPEQITMLNYHTGGFSGSNLFQLEGKDRDGTEVELYLVVIMKNTGPFHFKTMQVGVVSAMVVYLSVKEVEKRLAAGDRFVNTVWTKGHVLRRKLSFEPSFEVAEVDWKGVFETESKIVENAKTCMNNLFQVLNNSSGILMMDIVFLLLRNIYEIGVGTYTRCAIGFQPLKLTLDEQVDWTGLFDRILIDFVFPDSELDRARLLFIMNPKTVWWQNKQVGISRVSKPEYREVAREVKIFFDKRFDDVLQQLKQYCETVPESV